MADIIGFIVATVSGTTVIGRSRRGTVVNGRARRGTNVTGRTRRGSTVSGRTRRGTSVSGRAMRGTTVCGRTSTSKHGVNRNHNQTSATKRDRHLKMAIPIATNDGIEVPAAALKRAQQACQGGRVGSLSSHLPRKGRILFASVWKLFISEIWFSSHLRFKQFCIIKNK